MFAAEWTPPFGFDALAFLLSAAVIARMTPLEAPRPGNGRPERLRTESARGLGFVWSTPSLRTPCGRILVTNPTGVGALSVWVVYAQRHLGLSTSGSACSSPLAPFWVAAGAVALLVPIAWRSIGFVENAQFLR
ncbi:hypothetical protein [Nocardiopsis sp. Huas11]|uniref:hypothetical protein n=1 Tax=Nocardiopsis sp. Huas11 TaxID=2183912 RepID=UPI000EB243A4|nr:hypothetical protein [Nocardiopsis sp. Huas11]